MKCKIICSLILVWIIYGINLSISTAEDAIDKKTNRLPPQPTLVTGDIESLIPLAATDYMEGKPVLFFSGANQAKNPSKLLGLSNSVVFHNTGFLELLLDMFPGSGHLFTDLPSDPKMQCRYKVDEGILKINITKEGYYVIFAKLKDKNNGGSEAVISINKEVYYPSTSSFLPMEKMQKWMVFDKRYLGQDIHDFETGLLFSELIIIPWEDFQNYYENKKRLLQNKQVSYLISDSDEKGRKGEDAGKVITFDAPSPGEYQLLAHVSPINEEIKFRNVGFIKSGDDLMSDIQVIKDLTGVDASHIPVDVDLETYPNMEISYDLCDPETNSLGFILEIDTDEDNVVDTICYAGDMKYKEKALLNIDMSSITLDEKDFWYKVKRTLGKVEKSGMMKWHYDALGSGFSRTTENNTLVVSSDYSQSNHFVITKTFDEIDLTENQMVNLTYNVDNPEDQLVNINFRIDTDGDGRPDRIIGTNDEGYLTPGGYMRQSINVLARSGINPDDDKSICNLVEVILLCSGNGRFHLKNFTLGGQEIDIPLWDKKRILNTKSAENLTERNQGEGISLNKVLLRSDKKRDKGISTLNVNDILKQVQVKMPSVYNCTLMGINPIFYHKEQYDTVSFCDDNLEDVLQRLQFFGTETIEVPKLIADTQPTKQWQEKFEEETIRHSIENVVYRKDWDKEIYNVNEYALNDRFQIENVKENIVSEFEIDQWMIRGINTLFYTTPMGNGTEVHFSLNGGGSEEEKVAFFPRMSDYQGIDLKDSVTFDVSYKLSGTNTTELNLYMGVDFDHDGKEDVNLRLKPTSIENMGGGDGKKLAHFAMKEVIARFPEKRNISLLTFFLSIEKKKWVSFDNEKENEKKVILFDLKIKKRHIREDGVESYFSYDDDEGNTKIMTLHEWENVLNLDFADSKNEKAMFSFVGGWNVESKNSSYSLSYDKGALSINSDSNSIVNLKPLILNRKLNGINLQKYPYCRFQFNINETIIDDNFEKLWVELRGRHKEDRNFTVNIAGSRFKADMDFSVDLIKELKKIYPSGGNFVLDEVKIHIDPTFGKSNKKSPSYKSDRRGDDKRITVDINAVQIYGIKKTNVEEMLKETAVYDLSDQKVRRDIDINWESSAIGRTTFTHKTFYKEQHLQVYFNQDGLTEEGVLLKAVLKKPFHLTDVQTMEFGYTLQDSTVQGILAIPEFDDVHRASAISFLKLNKKHGRLSFNITEKARELFGEKDVSHHNLTSILFYLTKTPGLSCNENSLTDRYVFTIKNVAFTTTTTTTIITTLYEKLLAAPLIDINGKKYYFRDGVDRTEDRGQRTVGSWQLAVGNKQQTEGREQVAEGGKQKDDQNVGMLSSQLPFNNENPTISQLLSEGGGVLNLGNVDITGDDFRVKFLDTSDCFNVDMVELRKERPATRNNVVFKEPEIEFKKINPTRYVVDVKAEKPFWLVFSESYHEGWKAYVREGVVGSWQLAVGSNEVAKGENDEEPWSALISAMRDKENRFELTEHQMVNGYANGWLVPVGQKSEVRSQEPDERQRVIEAGKFQIVLEYKPQRLFEIGVLISGVTFVLCLGYLGWIGVRNVVTT